MEHFMRLSALSENEILEILNTADQLKFERKNKIKHKVLSGKTLGLLMNNPASSTRASFEVGMYDLGGHALMLSHSGLSDGSWETAGDYAAVLTRFMDAIALRTDSQDEAEAFARGSIVPVINVKTDKVNPCGALADLMTIREYKGSYKGRKICCIGHGSQLNSTIVGAVKMGMDVSVCADESSLPDSDIAKWAGENGNFEITDNIMHAAENADVIYITAWENGGRASFKVDSSVMKCAKEDAIVLHSLPVHREEEISCEVFEGHKKVIYDQAENSLHAQKAVLIKLLSDKTKEKKKLHI